MTEEFKPYKKDDRGEYFEHPSYGILGFNRAQSTNTPLFGSSIVHNNIITMRLHTAELCRHLSRDWVFARKLITEVYMSPTQFADAITGLNVGDGIPVTIRYITGDAANERPEPPFQSKTAQFNKEFADDMHEMAKQVDDVIALAKETKAQKRLITELEMLKQHIGSNIPFINKSFTEQMEKTVTEAKGEVEAFVNHLIVSTGIESLKSQSPRLTEPNEIKMIEGRKINERRY